MFTRGVRLLGLSVVLFVLAALPARGATSRNIAISAKAKPPAVAIESSAKSLSELALVLPVMPCRFATSFSIPAPAPASP